MSIYRSSLYVPCQYDSIITMWIYVYKFTKAHNMQGTKDPILAILHGEFVRILALHGNPG
jgi:hypothetical protein